MALELYMLSLIVQDRGKSLEFYRRLGLTIPICQSLESSRTGSESTGYAEGHEGHGHCSASRAALRPWSACWRRGPHLAVAAAEPPSV